MGFNETSKFCETKQNFTGVIHVVIPLLQVWSLHCLWLDASPIGICFHPTGFLELSLPFQEEVNRTYDDTE